MPARCGPVSVAVANHPGYFSAKDDWYVRALRPQVFVIPTWDSAHPTVNVLNTLYSKAIYFGNRDVFATSIQPEIALPIRRRTTSSHAPDIVLFA